MRWLLTGLLLLALGLTALAHEPWEPIAGRNDTVSWTQAEAAGREVYRKELCWHCHANFVRPLDDEYRRWGPVAWESGTQLPPDLQGGHRFGPSLASPPTWRSEDWLYASLHDPRSIDPRGVMPRFPELFVEPAWALREEVEDLIATYDADGDGRVSFVLDARPAWKDAGEDVARMAELDVAGLRVPPASALQSKGGAELWYDAFGQRAYKDVWRPGEQQGDGVLSLRDVRPQPSSRARALVAYLQRVQEPDAPFPIRRERGGLPILVDPGWSAAALYTQHCAHCHGTEGRGEGPAARYLDAPPTNLVDGPFKYRSTMHGQKPTLGDLERVIRTGLADSGMPSYAHLGLGKTRILAEYVRGFWGEKPPEQAPTVWELAEIRRGDGWRPPRMKLKSREDWKGYMQHVLRGKAVYMAFECGKCHGSEGRGDGPEPVAELSDGRRVRARDFRPRGATDDPRRRLRGGSTPEDLWRTIMAGLDKKAMTGAAEYFFGKNAAVGGDGVLHVPLKDPRLFYLGVRTHTENGTYMEVLEKLTREGFGDDWKLVLYVLHMARTQEEVAQRKMAWPEPYIEVVK